VQAKTKATEHHRSSSVPIEAAMYACIVVSEGQHTRVGKQAASINVPPCCSHNDRNLGRYNLMQHRSFATCNTSTSGQPNTKHHCNTMDQLKHRVHCSTRHAVQRRGMLTCLTCYSIASLVLVVYDHLTMLTAPGQAIRSSWSSTNT